MFSMGLAGPSRVLKQPHKNSSAELLGQVCGCSDALQFAAEQCQSRFLSFLYLYPFYFAEIRGFGVVLCQVHWSVLLLIG